MHGGRNDDLPVETPEQVELPDSRQGDEGSRIRDDCRRSRGGADLLVQLLGQLLGRIVGGRDACLTTAGPRSLPRSVRRASRPERGSDGASRRGIAPVCGGGRGSRRRSSKGTARMAGRPCFVISARRPFSASLRSLPERCRRSRTLKMSRGVHDSLQSCPRSVAHVTKTLGKWGCRAEHHPAPPFKQRTPARCREPPPPHMPSPAPASSLRSRREPFPRFAHDGIFAAEGVRKIRDLHQGSTNLRNEDLRPAGIPDCSR